MEREQDNAADEGKRAKGDRDHPPGEDKIGVVDLIGPAFLVRLCRFGGKARGLSLLRGEAFGFCGGLFRRRILATILPPAPPRAGDPAGGAAYGVRNRGR